MKTSQKGSLDEIHSSVKTGNKAGWRKWFAADTPMTEYMKFLTVKGI